MRVYLNNLQWRTLATLVGNVPSKELTEIMERGLNRMLELRKPNKDFPNDENFKGGICPYFTKKVLAETVKFLEFTTKPSNIRTLKTVLRLLKGK